MKKTKKTSKVIKFLKEKINYVLAFVIFTFFLFFSFTKMAQKAESSFYDLGLRVKPEVVEKDDVLLLNVDDLAIEKVGSWPWSRDILADVLVRLKELGGKTAVFDIEYLSPSLQAVNKDYIENTLPKEYSEVKSEIKEYIDAFSSSVQNKDIALKDVVEAGHEMSEYFENSISSLSDSVSSKVFKDNDAYFASTISFFGNTFLTINAVEINMEENSKEAKDFAYKNLLFSNVEDKEEYIKKETLRRRASHDEVYGIAPAILQLLQKAKGAGFPNVVIDSDGVRRRIPLLSEYNGKHVGQLVFSPLLFILQPEKIIRERNRLILKNAIVKNEKKDISIPLDEDGNLLINWLKKKFVDESNPQNSSFKNLSCYTLIFADTLEKQLIHSLDDILALNIRTDEGYLSYHNEISMLKNEYEGLLEEKTKLLNEESVAYDEYFSRRTNFFEDISTFLKGNSENEIHVVFEKVIQDSNEENLTSMYRQANEKVSLLFNNSRVFYKQYMEHVASIKKVCNGSFAIIGYSGVGTSDLGTNPFWNSYPNVGTHANVYNTIMTGEFITPISKNITILLSFALAFLSAFLLNRIQKGYVKIVFGIALSIALFGFFVALFAFLNIYIQIFMPLATVSLNFVLISFLSFIFTEKEKSFLRRAFGLLQYIFLMML